MDPAIADLATRTTIWFALACFFAAEIAAPWRADRSDLLVRWLWTVACAALLAHVACAFAFYHQWSHVAAYRHTAEETAAVVGWNWGGGLYFNYLMCALWLGDVAWWWSNPGGHRNRSKWLHHALHGFFWFMIFNATVVYGTGPVRWWGLSGCVAGLVGFVAARRKVS